MLSRHRLGSFKTFKVVLAPNRTFSYRVGQAKYGLFVNCIDTRYNGETRSVCSAPESLSAEWRATAVLLILSVLLILVATVFGALSYIRSPYLSYSKWIAFAGCKSILCRYISSLPHKSLKTYSHSNFPLARIPCFSSRLQRRSNRRQSTSHLLLPAYSRPLSSQIKHLWASLTPFSLWLCCLYFLANFLR